MARTDRTPGAAGSTTASARLPIDRRAVLAMLAAAGWSGSSGSAQAAPSPRIVSLDFGLAETLMALGIVPVGLAGADGWQTWVGGPPLPASVVNVGGAQNANYELIVSLRPDLILMTDFSAMLKSSLDRIAPVRVESIYRPDTKPFERSVDILEGFARDFGRETQARAYLSSVEARFADLRARLAGRTPRPVMLVSFLDTRHVRVYGTTGLYQAALDRLGIGNAWRGDSNHWGFGTVGIERLATEEDVELVVIEPVPPDLWPTLAESPLWRRIPFIEAGQVRVIPSSLMFGGVPSALLFADLLTASFAGRPA